MSNVRIMSKESTQLIAAAKYLEDVAYTLAGNIDATTVSQLISLSAEISVIEQRVCEKDTTRTKQKRPSKHMLTT